MPWDSDIDVQMSASTVHFLASYYNMTIHTYQSRNYMLEINPKYTDSSFKDKLNVIDGRWIDTKTGLFIDITAVRPKKKAKDIYASKDQHEEKVGIGGNHSANDISTVNADQFFLRSGISFRCVTASSKDLPSKYRTTTPNC